MQCQIKNLPVLAPLPHGRVQGVSGKDLTESVAPNSVPSSSSNPHTGNVDRGEFVPVVLEKFLESGIRQFDRALPVKNDDSQWAILYKRVQISGLFIEIDGEAVSLADLGSHDESYRGQHQHEQGDFGEQGRGRGEQMHRDYDSKIHRQQAGDNSPDSLTHRNPDDRNETQIKMIVTPILGSEHDAEDSEYRQALAKSFCERAKSEFRSSGIALLAGWNSEGVGESQLRTCGNTWTRRNGAMPTKPIASPKNHPNADDLYSLQAML